MVYVRVLLAKAVISYVGYVMLVHVRDSRVIIQG